MLLTNWLFYYKLKCLFCKEFFLKHLFFYSVVMCIFSFKFVLALDFPYFEWNLANYNGAYATFNKGLVSIANGGSDYWHVQLTRNNIDLQAGKTYEVEFFLQGVGTRRNVEVRIGRDGFPYDAFAEFGEIVATESGQTITKTFTMQSGDINNARFEFNLGSNTGAVYLSAVSLNCLDCGSNQSAGGHNSSAIIANDWNYVVVADSVDFRDNSMSLGNVFGRNLELGADTKIYGNVDVLNYCFLRERTHISGNLHYASFCSEQNNVFAKTKGNVARLKPSVEIPNINVGILPVSVGIDDTITLPPGNYGTFYANAKSKVLLSSGSYTFQSIFTEPDAKFTFDLTSGPTSIGVLNNVRFGDRNMFSITGGNPSEIQWNIAGENVNMGTDGLYFGKIIAPSAFVRISSRSHLVGAVYARKFQIEPQSTVSQEPRATEISHSEEHFGPFFEPGIFRYTSQLPLATSAVEMFVYADDARFMVNGETSTMVKLHSSKEIVDISLKQDRISGFPIEAFSSNYVFTFKKNENYRIYWNPQTSCRQGCDGMTPATAVGDFTKALEVAKTTGREINMVGGVWNVTEDYAEGVVPWEIGFELVGYTQSIWDLNAVNRLPIIFLGETSHILVKGKSPRSFVGFWIASGFNEESGGAIASETQILNLKNVLISANKSKKNGGSIYSKGTVNLNNVHIKNSYANECGGAIYVDGALNMRNVIMDRNNANDNGGAIYSLGDSKAQNIILSQNMSNKEGGGWFAENGSVKMTNATIFDNLGKLGNAAIGGNTTGEIYNSILWKNIKATCSSEKCLKDLSPSIAVHHSIVESTYNGEGNVLKNPLFVDENNPAGNNEYLSLFAGLTLQDASPAVGSGLATEFVPATDILGVSRNDLVDMGAYAWYDLNRSISMGYLSHGEFTAVNPAYPIFETFNSEKDILVFGRSAYGRVMRKTWKKQGNKIYNKVVVRFHLLDSSGNEYTDVDPVDVDFFYSGESNGEWIYQSLVKPTGAEDYDSNKHGRLMLFTSDLSKIGVYDDVIVFPIKKLTDRLRGEIIL